MRTLRIPTSYNPAAIPAQEAFIRSRAKFKGYGGAMGGGKTRTLCEEALHAALVYPGIEIVIARLEHTAIGKTTRKTFFREVLPVPLAKICRIISSSIGDFIEFPNGSVIHFSGLDDPVKWMSSEIGRLILDEAHEIPEDTVIQLQTRLRQKCQNCLQTGQHRCSHLPRDVLCGFNPESPGHWLWRYFMQDAVETPWGYRKDELRVEQDAPSIGDSEFFVAKAVDNPFLPESYVERELAGMKEVQRRRYLKGEWLFLSGSCVFDQQRLTEYHELDKQPQYRFDFEPVGIGDQAKRKKYETGHVHVYTEPVEDHSYAIGADIATGRGLDYSVAYVIDLSDMEFVAELRWKVDADLFAEQLHFLGRWYNTAWIAVELAGGFGEPVTIYLHDAKGGRPAYPRLYRHVMDTSVDQNMAHRWGYPINNKTRPLIINQLEQIIREKMISFLPSSLIQECLTFCEFEEGMPQQRAQPGCHDDCVMAAAITLELYRRYGRHVKRDERIAKRRHKRPKTNWYPWQKPVPA